MWSRNEREPGANNQGERWKAACEQMNARIEKYGEGWEDSQPVGIKLIDSMTNHPADDCVYVPLEISGGIPHCFCTKAEATKNGATNIRPHRNAETGVEEPWAGLVADWPRL